MKKYLSIGEVSKIKGISHRALRHYDKLGILVPAYVNAENGYRYYSRNQLIVLDIIILCVSLDIPLKSFKNYIFEDGSIDAKKMIDDAKLKARKIQKEIEDKLYFLDSATQHFIDTKVAMPQSKTYTKHITKRYFLTIDASAEYAIYENFWSKMTMLYARAIKQNFAMSINQGLCFWIEDAVLFAKYYVEIKKPKVLQKDILEIQTADFLCEVFEGSCFSEALEKYCSNKSYLDGNILIINDIFEQRISNKQTPFEIQLML